MNDSMGRDLRGFTLLETLLFLAVFGLVVLTTTQFLGQLCAGWLAKNGSMARNFEFANFLRIFEDDVKWPPATGLERVGPEVYRILRQGNAITAGQSDLIYFRDSNGDVRRLVLGDCSAQARNVLTGLKSGEEQEAPGAAADKIAAKTTILLRHVEKFQLLMEKSQEGEISILLRAKFLFHPGERCARFYLDEI